MRIAKPIFGSVATIKSRIALLDQALGRLRPTAHRDIGGLHQRYPSLRRWPALKKKLSSMSERGPFARPLL
jgi:hypothetical protein